ncbi:LPS-assembly protein LptD [Entomospira nematocerorum]|uniref:LPS-assembly protein LptD n=1 Tax=Entomospira nematocerorum TaxID=2719987 RepID=A0A968GBT8_9SPIO|nr:LPS-assembly protein LptD [Entomospira nematocera]NIZ46987.1 LPS-assembly protein LptD [Entomospira nematocera]WDI34467.1 LPS-assembly protein LptD [Entomospira nematocera]
MHWIRSVVIALGAMVLWVHPLFADDEIEETVVSAIDETVEVSEGSEEQERVIVIEGAHEFYFGKMGDLQENFLELRGGVVVSIEENGVKHRIRADLLRFDRDANLIFATGNVEYEVVTSGQTQRFAVANLLFESTNLSGLLVGIYSTQSDQGFSLFGDVPFFYQADHVVKHATGTVTIHKIWVATSQMKDPFWRLEADMVWTLSDDSWVVRHPLLYIGRVPVFYFPFYYHGDNIFFFNPVFGYSSLYGFTVNTTTHVWGKPSNAAQLGMFNFNFSSNANKSDNQGNNRLALMLDYYGRTGVMLGIWGGFNWADIDYKLGFAFTRALFSDGTVVDSQGNIHRESGYFFGRKVPFRYGLMASGSWEDLSFGIRLFSDPRFKSDFFTHRRVGADWFGFITLQSAPWQLVPTETETSYIRYNRRFYIGLAGLETVTVHYANSELLLEPKYNQERVSSYASSSYFYALRDINAINMSVSVQAKPVFGAAFNTQASLAEQWSWWQPGLYYEARVEERLSAMRYGTRSSIPSEDWSGPLEWKNLISSRAEAGGTFNWANRLDVRIGLTSQTVHNHILAPSELTVAQETMIERQNLVRFGGLWQVAFSPFKEELYWRNSYIRYQAQVDFFENAYDVNLKKRTSQWKWNFRLHRLQAQLRYDTGLYWAYTSVSGSESVDTLTHERVIVGEVKAGVGVDWYDWRTETYLYTNRLSRRSAIKYGWGISTQYEPWSFLGIYGDLRIDLKTKLDYAETSIRLWGLRAGFIWQEREKITWSKENYFWQTEMNSKGEKVLAFQTSYFYVRLDQPILWKNDYTWIKDNFEYWDLSIVGDLRLDMVRYTDSKLEFGFRWDWRIKEQLRLRVTTTSYHESIHTYIPFMREKLGITGEFSFWRDLWQSFNFANTEMRRASPFKIGRVRVELEWQLPDWVLGISYQGNPSQNYNIQGMAQSSWRQKFELWVKWRPIPALAAGVQLDEEGIWSNKVP